MSDGAKKKGLALDRFAPVLWVALAWVGAWFTAGHEMRSSPQLWSDILDFLDRFTFRAFGGFPAAQQYVANLIRLIDWSTFPTFVVYGGWAMFLVPLGFVARMVARARLRSGARDPIDRLRAWVVAHPRSWAAIVGVLPAIWGIKAFDVLITDHRGFGLTPAQVLPVVTLSALFEYVAARGTFRAFLQPTVDPEEELRIEIGPDEIKFDAVAVTRETRAAVGALAGLSVAMTAWIAVLPIGTLYRDRRLFAAMVAYMVVVVVSATLFRLASRVAVGIDGVLVKGTSKTRFFAYRDVDAVRVVRGDIELVRRDRTVLRLQLHGADAVRRDAVAARIRENIERVQRGEHAVAAQLVSSASKGELARVASGGADYRAASLSREALWKLIEGPTVDAESRRAAAEALAKTSDDSERARLRVAAEHCADPRVRVALAELAEPPPPPLPPPEAEVEAVARGAVARL
jgi:hypothetical protein